MKSKHGFITTIERSRLMSKIKSKDTTPEKALRSKLWSLGIRFRKSNFHIIGKPDILIKKYMLIVFIDGEFWHGYNWKEKKGRIKSNRDYWIKKIEGNMQRDRKITRQLEKDGWKVLRFWEKEITFNLEACIDKIKNEIKLK